MTKKEGLAMHRDAILALARKHGVTDVRVFGSVARDEERGESDVDLIVRRLPGSDPFALIDLKDELEALLHCRVDLLTEHRWMRQPLKTSIERDALAI